MMQVRFIVAAFVLVSAARSTEAGELVLAGDGAAGVRIVLAAEATAAEATAARELAEYLGRITAAKFDVVEERAATNEPAIHVGPTALARAAAVCGPGLGPEEWAIRRAGPTLVLCGGRPRGTLYAVYHFLEDELGVRWWTPFEEHVPRRGELRVGELAHRGRPAFAYRDVFLGGAYAAHAARSRLNGDTGAAPPSWGGSERYGPPHHAHTFRYYVPVEEFFDEHPEYFSEVGGFRVAGQTQLCLTQEALLPLVRDRLLAHIERSRAEALRLGLSPPRIFSFSANDWFHPCTCAACSVVAAREGGHAGPLIHFVNALADSIAASHPDVLLDTLAYSFTIDPPRQLHARDNVSVRFAGLYERDFAKPVTDPANARYRRALQGWARRTRHLRVWDYPVIFGDAGEFPIPNLRFAAEDYRFYREQGVEGVFVQHHYPIAADMRDLKVWVQAKLLEDPYQDPTALVRRFTDGYYGPAAAPIRRYLSALGRNADRQPSTVRYRSSPADYGWLGDARFMRRAHRLFDRAESRCGDDAVTRRRVRHARLALDRATLVLWRELSRSGLFVDLESLARRYRAAWFEQIDLRFAEAQRGAAREEVEQEIRYWTATERSPAP